MMLNIHYDPTTGNIDGYDTDPDSPARPGLAVVWSRVDEIPNVKLYKVNTDTLWLVPKTVEEITEANRPTKAEVNGAVYVTLLASDVYMLPDYPVTPEVQDSWKVYRQALRDLSKGSPAPTADEMIAAWPLDPNGNDAIANLKERQ